MQISNQEAFVHDDLVGHEAASYCHLCFVAEGKTHKTISIYNDLNTTAYWLGFDDAGQNIHYNQFDFGSENFNQYEEGFKEGR